MADNSFYSKASEGLQHGNVTLESQPNVMSGGQSNIDKNELVSSFTLSNQNPISLDTSVSCFNPQQKQIEQPSWHATSVSPHCNSIKSNIALTADAHLQLSINSAINLKEKLFRCLQNRKLISATASNGSVSTQNIPTQSSIFLGSPISLSSDVHVASLDSSCHLQQPLTSTSRLSSRVQSSTTTSKSFSTFKNEETDSWKVQPPAHGWNFYREQENKLANTPCGTQLGNIPHAFVRENTSLPQENSSFIPSSKSPSNLKIDKIENVFSQGSRNLISPQAKLKDKIISSVQKHVQQSTNHSYPVSSQNIQSNALLGQNLSIDTSRYVGTKSSNISPYDFAENELKDSQFEKPAQRLYHKSPPRKSNISSQYNKHVASDNTHQRYEQMSPGFTSHFGVANGKLKPQERSQGTYRKHELHISSRPQNDVSKTNPPPHHSLSEEYLQNQLSNSVLSLRNIQSDGLPQQTNNSEVKDSKAHQLSPSMHQQLLHHNQLQMSQATFDSSLSMKSENVHSEQKLPQNMHVQANRNTPSPFNNIQDKLKPHPQSFHRMPAIVHNSDKERGPRDHLNQVYKQQNISSFGSHIETHEGLNDNDSLMPQFNCKSENTYDTQKTKESVLGNSLEERAFNHRNPFNPPVSNIQSHHTPLSLKESNSDMTSSNLKVGAKRVQSSPSERNLFPNGMNPMPNLQQVQQQIWNFFNGIGIENMWDQMRGNAKEQTTEDEPVKKKTKKKKKVTEGSSENGGTMSVDKTITLGGNQSSQAQSSEVTPPVSAKDVPIFKLPQKRELEFPHHGHPAGVSSSLCDRINQLSNNGSALNIKPSSSMLYDEQLIPTMNIKQEHSTSHNEKSLTLSSLENQNSSRVSFPPFEEKAKLTGNEVKPSDNEMVQSLSVVSSNSLTPNTLTSCENSQINFSSLPKSETKPNSVPHVNGTDLSQLNQNKLDHFRVDLKDGSLKRQTNSPLHITKPQPISTHSADRMSLPGMSYFTTTDMLSSDIMARHNSIPQKTENNNSSSKAEVMQSNSDVSGHSVEVFSARESDLSSKNHLQDHRLQLVAADGHANYLKTHLSEDNAGVRCGKNSVSTASISSSESSPFDTAVNKSLSHTVTNPNVTTEAGTSYSINKPILDANNSNSVNIKQECLPFSASCMSKPSQETNFSAQKLEWDPEFVNSNKWISDILGDNVKEDKPSVSLTSVINSNSVSSNDRHQTHLPFLKSGSMNLLNRNDTENPGSNDLLKHFHNSGIAVSKSSSHNSSQPDVDTRKTNTQFWDIMNFINNPTSKKDCPTAVTSNNQISMTSVTISDSVNSFHLDSSLKYSAMDTCVKSVNTAQTTRSSVSSISTNHMLPPISSTMSSTHSVLTAAKPQQGSQSSSLKNSSEQIKMETSFILDSLKLNGNNGCNTQMVTSNAPAKVFSGESYFSTKDSLNSEMFLNKEKDGRSAGTPIHPTNIKQENCDMELDKQFDNYNLENVLTAAESFKLDEMLKNNTKIEIPDCGCLGPDYVYNESIEGPYYTHLGAAKDIPGIRKILENRTGYTGSAIRIEKIIYTGKEGKSSQGCPIAKWIIRRSGIEEKMLCLVRQRPGHQCDTAWIIVTITAWEGVPREMADDLYSYVTTTVTDQGFETDRRCGTNDKKTCACQGTDLKSRGASFSFGCSWSMYFNGCKFARSRDARKFKLKDSSQESVLEDKFQNLATHVGPLYAKIAPDAHRNQTRFEKEGLQCRLGKEPGRPFCGVTSCMDFCAHAHKDLHNMNNGSTVVVTLTKHRSLEKPDDEQLHVLPLYVMDMTDEFGTTDGQLDKIESGALEVLENYPLLARIRAFPLTPKKKGKCSKKDGSASKRYSPKRYNPKAKQQNTQGQSPLPRSQSVPPNVKEEPNQFVPEFSYHRPQSQCSIPGSQPDISTSLNSNFKKPNPGSIHPALKRENICMSYPELMTHSFNPYFPLLYETFWNYFYTHGVFPPHNVLSPLIPMESMLVRDRLCMQQSNVYPNSSLNQGHTPSVSIKQEPPDPQQLQYNGQCRNSNVNKLVNPHVVHPSQPMGTNNGLSQSHSVQKIDENRPLNLTSQCEGVKRNLSNCAYNQPVLSNSAMNSYNSQSAPLDLSTDNQPIDYRCKDNVNKPLNLHSETAAIKRSPSMENQFNCNQSKNTAASSAPFHMQTSQGPSQPNQFNSHSSNIDRCQSVNLSLGANSGRDVPFQMDTESRPDCSDGCMRDPSTIISCEMEYNEESFADPRIGGVAIALQHGAVLFEVAKRELHATTALRNPNRYKPTRISLVFYQHKNLNYANHGWKEYEHKLEILKQKRLEKLRKDSEIGTVIDLPPTVEEKKKKKKKSDTVDFAKTSAAKYKYMWEVPARRETAVTTNTFVTSWIDPQPIITGPYQKYNGYQ